MDIKYPIENNYMKCVLQINGISGPRPLVRSKCLVVSGRVRGGATYSVRPEKFQFMEKGQNCNFGQKSGIYFLDIG